MPDDHSKLVPPLPIPNRTVKRLRADDSADSRVKVGHRQALIPHHPPRPKGRGVCLFVALTRSACAHWLCTVAGRPGLHVPAAAVYLWWILHRRDRLTGLLPVWLTPT